MRVEEIIITEPHLASNESRDEVGVSKVEVEGQVMTLWQLDHDGHGIHRTYVSAAFVAERRSNWKPTS